MTNDEAMSLVALLSGTLCIVVTGIGIFLGKDTQTIATMGCALLLVALYFKPNSQPQ